jgi:aminoglycoside phosphotransferase (APT) family kinase protein
MMRSRHVGLELGRRVPLLADRVGRLLDRLATVHERVGSRGQRPIHGDPHADQWLDEGERLGLVDFESLALGDPELDAAVFLAELDFEDTRVLPVEELEAAYLAGAAAAGLTLEPDLLRAYRAHKRLAKALRSATSLRVDGDKRAEAHLELAMELLTG